MRVDSTELLTRKYWRRCDVTWSTW